jgi:hypothetical protein
MWSSRISSWSGAMRAVLGRARLKNPDGARCTGRAHGSIATSIAERRRMRRPARPSAARSGDRPRIAVEDGDVERADVDAELERRGRDDAVELPARSGARSRALRRQIAAAIRRDARGLARIVIEQSLRYFVSTSTIKRDCANTIVLSRA